LPAPSASPEPPATFETLTTEPLSDPAAFAQDIPERDARVRRYFESRRALPGDSEADADEQRTRVKEDKSSGGQRKKSEPTHSSRVVPRLHRGTNRLA
jgi:hypothetical protein